MDGSDGARQRAAWPQGWICLQFPEYQQLLEVFKGFESELLSGSQDLGIYGVFSAYGWPCLRSGTGTGSTGDLVGPSASMNSWAASTVNTSTGFRRDISSPGTGGTGSSGNASPVVLEAGIWSLRAPFKLGICGYAALVYVCPFPVKASAVPGGSCGNMIVVVGFADVPR